MTAQLLAFGVNMLLGFILVPVIESMIPNAYGFTDIANKFVSAAQIIVSALNTMASRRTGLYSGYGPSGGAGRGADG